MAWFLFERNTQTTVRSHPTVSRAQNEFGLGGIGESRPRPRLRPGRGERVLERPSRAVLPCGLRQSASVYWAARERLMGRDVCTVKFINSFIFKTNF